MIPIALRRWFVVHFVADIVFAVPLVVAPDWFLTMLGWEAVDPISARLVGAALVGIGVESWLGRNNREPESFATMLRLKILWSGVATFGIAMSIWEGAPLMAWAFLAIFGSFHLLWWYWFVRVRDLQNEA